MPMYQYKCQDEECQTIIKDTFLMDDPVPDCPECGGEMKRYYGYGKKMAPGVAFKGNNFTRTTKPVSFPDKKD